MTYTREDVIIWPDDPRLKDAIGKECFFSDFLMDIVDYANNGGEASHLVKINLDDEDLSFFISDDELSLDYHFIIIKKEPQKHYVPFDFSKKEDRDAVRGKWIRYLGSTDEDLVEEMIYRISYYYGRTSINENLCDDKELFERFVFADGPNDGKPVGKEVEE